MRSSNMKQLDRRLLDEIDQEYGLNYFTFEELMEDIDWIGNQHYERLELLRQRGKLVEEDRGWRQDIEVEDDTRVIPEGDWNGGA